jgi:alpha-glucoside transport system substrate-binding protein
VPSPREAPRRHRVAIAAAALAVSAALVSCADGSEPDREVVEVFGPIVGPSGERLGEALREASERTGIELRYVGVTSFNEQLADRLDRGDRPNVALLPQPSLLVELSERGVARPLSDELVAVSEAQYPPGLVEIASIDGRPAAIWLTVDVKGLVWYRPDEFAERGLEVPASLDELAELVEAIRATDDGVAPWCIAIEAGAATGWVGTDWVESYVLRRLGPEQYDAWTTGSLRFDSPEIGGVFDELGALTRAAGTTAGGARAVLTTPWARAADDLLADPARCLMTLQADFLSRECPAGTAVGPDGSVDAFVLPPAVGGDEPPAVFGGMLATPFDSSAATSEAMSVLAGAELAEHLDATPDFASPHLGIERDATDDVSARLLRDAVAAPVLRFDGSDVMPPAVGTGTFWAGMRSFYANEAIDSVLAQIQDGWSSSD